MANPGNLTIVNSVDGSRTTQIALPVTESQQALQWCDDRYLVLSRQFLVDLDQRTIIWKYELPSESGKSLARIPPDTRLRFVESDQLVAVPAPSQQLIQRAGVGDIRDQGIVSPGSSVKIGPISVNLPQISQTQVVGALTKAFARHNVEVVSNSEVEVHLSASQAATGTEVEATSTMDGNRQKFRQ